MDVMKPNEKQFAEILRWLKKEQVETGDGFYQNINVVMKAFRERCLLCGIIDRSTVAFAVVGIVGELGHIAIIEVHPAQRLQGIGHLLATHVFDYLRLRRAKRVFCECISKESESFCQKLGFTVALNDDMTASEYWVRDL